jgi:hypothetical protein
MYSNTAEELIAPLLDKMGGQIHQREYFPSAWGRSGAQHKAEIAHMGVE